MKNEIDLTVLNDLIERVQVIEGKAKSLKSYMGYGWKRFFKRDRLSLSKELRAFKKDVASINKKLIELEKEYEEFLKK